MQVETIGFTRSVMVAVAVLPGESVTLTSMALVPNVAGLPESTSALVSVRP